MASITISVMGCAHEKIDSQPAYHGPGFIIAPRDSEAMTGSAFARLVSGLDLESREIRIYDEILSGNIPAFLREPQPVSFTERVNGRSYTVTFYAMPDYLAIGSNDDHLLMPMTPILAQRIMTAIQATLPTPKMVDLIWQEAGLKLTPEPIPPSAEMVTIPVFQDHADLIDMQRQPYLEKAPLGTLVAGHKKDVVISNRIATHPSKVVIYGWQKADGQPIQPLYSGHVNWYADYSHGIRPVLSRCLVNDSLWQISNLLADPHLFRLLSDELAPMSQTRYDTLSSNYPKKSGSERVSLGVGK